MPTPYTVTRSTTINAPRPVVLDLLTDFHQWVHWSPWEGLDPAMRRSYSGPDSGVGAGYAWEGNKQAGKGTMTVTGATDEQVDVDLHFDKPFPADNKIVFTLTESTPGSTTVRWDMHGQLNLVMRLFSIVKSMDSMVGPDFEKGLRQLRTTAESRASQ